MQKEQRRMGKGTLSKSILGFIALLIVGCNPIPSNLPCNLPDISADVPIMTVESVGTWGIYQDYCPVEINRSFTISRDFGVIKFEWRGSPHRLYIAVLNDFDYDFELLTNHPEIKLQGLDSDSEPLSSYTAKITFPNQRYAEPTVSVQEIELIIKDRKKKIIDQIIMTYSSKECTCVSFDAI
jgi:hypothetical protein